MDKFLIFRLSVLCVLLSFSAESRAIKWQSVSCADYASAAVSTKGDLYVTGRNYNGVLGDGKDSIIPGYRKRWAKVAKGMAVVELNSDHSLAITKKGKLLTTGNNDFGQLGTGRQENRKRWLTTLTGVSAASVGYKSTLALKTDGSLWVTGVSELGDRNSLGNFYSPHWQRTLDDVRSAVAGSQRAYALNEQGELLRITYPTGSTPPISPPQWEALATEVQDIEVFSPSFFNEIVFKKSDNTLWWGNDFGTPTFKQIASDVDRFKGSPQGLLVLDNNSALAIAKYASTGTLLAIQRDVIDFCAGAQHALVVKSDGSLWAAGVNNQGQFGFNNGKGTSSLNEWVKVKVP